jgi:DNA repair protein RadC
MNANYSLDGFDLETASNHSLMAALVGTDVAHAILQKFSHLNDIAKATCDDLTSIPGVGVGKAQAIKSAFLLAKRLTCESYSEAPLLDTPERVADLLRETARPYTVETFITVLLNTRRRLIRVCPISQGTLDTLLVHPREVFKPAIGATASAVILAHNHPSGDPTPSEADIKVTRDLIRAGQLLKIEVLDHVILGQATTERPRDFVSLRELGYFYAA